MLKRCDVMLGTAFKISLILAAVCCAMPVRLSTAIAPDDPRIRYVGRHTLNGSVARFDWVGSGLALQIAAAPSADKSVLVDMDGAGNSFALYRQSVHMGDLVTAKGGGRRIYSLSPGFSSSARLSAGETISMLKSTEDGSAENIVTVYGLRTEVELTAHPARPSRRIDVYGDSDSAAYGVDGSEDGTLACLSSAHGKENFAHGWATNVALKLGAELHTQAVSGIGVYKNAAMVFGKSVGCSMKIPLPHIIHRSLQFEDTNDYNATQWQPDVFVVYAGSNDMINLFPPTESEFTDAYRGLIQSIVSPFLDTIGRAVYHKVVHICNNVTASTHPCDWVRAVAGETKGVFSSTFGVPASGCVGHRNVTEQATLAEHIAPVIAAVAGW